MQVSYNEQGKLLSSLIEEGHSIKIKRKMTNKELEFNRNDDKMRLRLSELQRKLDKIYQGGGKNKIEKHHAKGKLTARERIDELLDKDSNSIEIGALAGYEMYKDHGGCPSGGVVVVLGYIHGRLVIVVANDATVKAGAWFPITGKKKPESAGNCY